MPKSKDNTGFRNGDLFCFHCGRSQKMPLPMDVELAVDFMQSFAKHHRNCEKTWEEPHWSSTAEMKDVDEKAQWWYNNANRGTSSEYMMAALCKKPYIGFLTQRYPHPEDPSDFYRCWFLIKAIPEWKDQLHLLKGKTKFWDAIIDNWDKLSDMIEEQIQTQKDNGMYDFMKSIFPVG